MKTITSFSYKGGAGRTVASANIAAALAAKRASGAVRSPLNFKVALIDLDVFSAGMHRVFEISNKGILDRESCIQDFLLREIDAADYVATGGLIASDPLMQSFLVRGGTACRDDFTLFPASPTPDRRFNVQKYHENNLISLMRELETQEFDYVVIDGESGTRAMADIAVRLADVVLMFFRLTWQHIEGSLAAMEDFLKWPYPPAFYLIPTCVPLVGNNDGVFNNDAPGLDELRAMTKAIPRDSGLNDIADRRAAATEENQQAYGHFWANQMCIHDSLVLKGEERVLVYDEKAAEEMAASDYYRIAAEIAQLHNPLMP